MLAWRYLVDGRREQGSLWPTNEALDWHPEVFRLDGKVAVVTGAGQGRAFSLALAKSGAEVVLLDIAGENIEEVAREIEEQGSRAWPKVRDVTDAEQVADTLASVECLDVLVNNAGTNVTELSSKSPTRTSTRCSR